jgi:molybdate transport system ATP-binding protein
MSLQVDIRKTFGEFTLEVAFAAGSETLGFLGASGCGKSLTMRCIAGLEKPDAGRIVVNDTVFFDSAAKINLKPQQRKTALLFQDYQLFPNMSVADNIAAGMPRDLPKEQRHERIAEQLRRFHIEGFGKRYPASLSGGQRQRVALARMLAASPGILMLDEPFSALDAHLKASLEQNLLDLFDEYEGTILYVSHDIDEALRFCDRIAIIDHGNLMQMGTGDEIIEDPRSLAALKVSGVKNISPVRVLESGNILAEDWGIELRTAQPAPANTEYCGIRASYLQIAEQNGPNVVECLSRRTSDSRFERPIILEPLSQTPATDLVKLGTVPNLSCPSGQVSPHTHGHGGRKQGLIEWRVSRLGGSPVLLRSKGERILLHIPPQSIYLVNE